MDRYKEGTSVINLIVARVWVLTSVIALVYHLIEKSDKAYVIGIMVLASIFMLTYEFKCLKAMKQR